MSMRTKKSDVLTEVRKAIAQDPRSWYRLAKDSGLKYEVLRRIANGTMNNAKVATLDKIGRALGYEVHFVPRVEK